MIQNLKFSCDEDKFFVISDLHYGHNKDFIYTKRKNYVTGKYYTSSEEHDEGIIESWNSVCDNDSIVFNCGDTVFEDPDGKKFLKLIRSLKFREQYILLGNHNSGVKDIYYKTLSEQGRNLLVGYGTGLVQESYPLVMLVDGNPDKRIIFLPEYAEANVNGKFIVFCHYPILSFNKQSKHSLLFCGHSHSNNKLTNKDTGSGFRLDVGVESFGRPISLKEAKALFKNQNRDIDSWDHHNPETVC